MNTIEHYSVVHDLKSQVEGLKDEVAYLNVQMNQLKKIAVFYENELERILDHEDFEHLMKEGMHMLLLDPHKYDDYE